MNTQIAIDMLTDMATSYAAILGSFAAMAYTAYSYMMPHYTAIQGAFA